MPKTAGTFMYAAILCSALFAFAFAAAPRSCQWGLNTYFWIGVAAILILMATPMIRNTALAPYKRVALSLGLGVLAAAVWFAGIFAANFQILCRLF
jgi:hypothetical protein